MINDNIIDIGYLSECKAVIMQQSSREIFKEPESSVTIGKYTVCPWGKNNDLPQQVMKKIKKSEVVNSNLLFNTLVAYGQGIKPAKRVIKKGKTTYEDVTDQQVLDFFEENDITGWWLESCTDMKTFFNVFPEVILSNDGKTITELSHKEAVYSRWTVMNKKTAQIDYHLYSSKWDDSPSEENVEPTPALHRKRPLKDLRERIEKGSKDRRFVIPVTFPTPGKLYYSEPAWWSIFESGWYDFLTMIPEFKKALLKNQMAVRFIIYISDKYWSELFQAEGIDVTDNDAVVKRKQEEYDKFNKFLSGEKNAGKAIVALKKFMAAGNSGAFEKYVEIEPIKGDIKGGEYIEDSEEVSNIVSYAMSVHPSLIGSTPGKNKGSFSGTDKRELFMIKQAMEKPFRDRILRVLTVIKRYNNWPEDIVFMVPDIEFTTLDEKKNGKKEVEKE
ncbi:MAG: hypothetical protein N4A72_00895 [Bacteroidales bacterium]|jgi:hypothetical protein|nr:hypothetical protein [Bacteroidales bacterium]